MDFSTSFWRGPVCLVCILLLSFILEIPILNANSVYPDHRPHSAASDIGQHCLCAP